MPERLFSGLRLRALTQMVCLTLALILMTGTPGSAFEQERRVALVITVGGYDFLPGLDNPVRDGQLIAKSLRDVGFEVTRIVDGSKAEILTALERFAFTSEVADVSLVYFAGHGFEFEGQNYLAPADTKADSRQIAQQGAIPLNHLTASVSRARQLRIIALDACRNDPFGAATGGITTPSVQSNETISIAESGARGTGGGLAVPPATRGTLISFAAAAGHVALDGEGSNSPYAVALSQALTAPDLEIGLSFRKLRDDVMETTRRLQVPHTYGSLSGNPYFLAGRSTQNNQLENLERKFAWSGLSPSQFEQVEALVEEGDPRALKALAYMQLSAQSEHFNPASAAELLGRAAAFDDPEAQYELGKLFEVGIGVDQDVARALELYDAAAGKDHGDALNDLGFLHYQGGLGIPRSPSRGIDYFQRAAETGHPEAMFNIAALIDDGVVPGADLEDAARYLYLALRSGNSDVLAELQTNPNAFKRDVRLGLQRRLAEAGFYSGAIDADFGAQTRRGLRAAFGDPG